MDILQVQSLSAGYGGKPVLKDINLTVRPGEFVSVVAPNGAGKSTLLKAIAGIIPDRQGSILIKGRDIAGYSRRELARKVAVVGSELTGFEYTVAQMVLLGRFAHIGRFSGPSANDYAIAQAVMEAVRIEDKKWCLCRELSQGERQKVIIARALAQQPELLLLDEPTAHFDICNQYGILRLIKELATSKQIGVIAVIHDVNLALQFSTHLLFLKEGRMMAYGRPREVLSPDTLQQLYGMSFTMFRDAAATYVMPCAGNEIDLEKTENEKQEGERGIMNGFEKI